MPILRARQCCSLRDSLAHQLLQAGPGAVLAPRATQQVGRAQPCALNPQESVLAHRVEHCKDQARLHPAATGTALDGHHMLPCARRCVPGHFPRTSRPRTRAAICMRLSCQPRLQNGAAGKTTCSDVPDWHLRGVATRRPEHDLPKPQAGAGWSDPWFRHSHSDHARRLAICTIPSGLAASSNEGHSGPTSCQQSLQMPCGQPEACRSRSALQHWPNAIQSLQSGPTWPPDRTCQRPRVCAKNLSLHPCKLPGLDALGVEHHSYCLPWSAAAASSSAWLSPLNSHSDGPEQLQAIAQPGVLAHSCTARAKWHTRRGPPTGLRVPGAICETGFQQEALH
mmetsp:Transcript_95864/g.169740  ORF Transcript_95864/g.169740 Transcript_95864/m.169740 type:complete len:338 (-) Transcript_95864:510-1523(-)